MTNKRLSLLLAAALLLCGCGKKQRAPAATEPPTGAAEGKASLENLIAKPAADPAPPPAAPSAEAPAGPSTSAPDADKQVIEVKDLTAALHDWLIVHSNYPKDLNELVKENFIPKLPPAPPGKRFALDRRDHRVILVDK
jgi:hypothetical protein